ncbi:MAG: peptide ABC transporter substrate-binding protein [Anaerolineae bacterium]|nr:peptide ABC transporter substrate-binding protein [Anaerolineae bacterium]
MFRNRFLALIVILVLLVGTLGVSAQDDSVVLRVDLTQEMDTLNPLYTNMWFSTTVMDLYLASPWFIDDELNAVPVLVTEIPTAENGGISEDGTVITLNLRDDIVWSDGEPITSADFVFTYDMIIDEANTPASRFPYAERVASVEAPDAQTVVVTFNEPYAPWLSVLFTNGSAPLPKHVLEPVFESEGTIDFAAWNRAPEVGSGPFTFVEWQEGSLMRFVKNENWYGDEPAISEVFIRFVPDDATVVAALVSEDTDVGTFIAYGDVPSLEESGKINVELVQSSYNEGWFFNVDPETAHPAMLDVNVRKALVMGFNRDQINEDLNLGITYTPASYWENTPYARPDAAPLPYDPEAAAQLLDEAGWVDSDGDGVRDKDGVALELRYLTNQRQIRQDVQVVAQQQLGDIGVSLLLENYPSEVFFGSYIDDAPTAHGRYDIQEFSSPTNFPDPSVTRWLCSEIPTDESPDGVNDQRYCNEEFDSLMAQADSETDTNARIELFHQMDQIITDDAIWAGIWYDPDLWAINNRFENTRISGADPFWNISDWTVAS